MVAGERASISNLVTIQCEVTVRMYYNMVYKNLIGIDNDKTNRSH